MNGAVCTTPENSTAWPDLVTAGEVAEWSEKVEDSLRLVYSRPVAIASCVYCGVDLTVTGDTCLSHSDGR